MEDEEINRIICEYIDKLDIPDEFYKAVIFMRDKWFKEKEKNQQLLDDYIEELTKHKNEVEKELTAIKKIKPILNIWKGRIDE